ncbi:MAG: recombinase family protein, partial [Clostridiales bacterium]|nr:recombinase family protein [Clostridiales bacterium]
MVAIYARQSVDKKDSISIETQIDNAMKFAGTAPYKIYRDRGFSGKNTDRPDFKKLMRDIKDGLVEKVIVYKIDRISRSIVDFGSIMDVFSRHAIEFISVSESFDTSSPMGKAMLYIIMVFAQLERETIQARIRDNYYARGEKAFGLSGMAPWGYKKVPTRHLGKKTHTYEIDRDKEAVIQQIFRWYVGDENATLYNIAARLNESDAIDKKFNHTFISRLLKNPFYVKANADIYNYLRAKDVKMNNGVGDYTGEKGLYIYGDKKACTKGNFSDEALALSYATVALHDGMIDADIWLRAQAKLKRKRLQINGGSGEKTWLAGLMK